MGTASQAATGSQAQIDSKITTMEFGTKLVMLFIFAAFIFNFRVPLADIFVFIWHFTLAGVWSSFRINKSKY